jgi:hypothetical protein
MKISLAPKFVPLRKAVARVHFEIQHDLIHYACVTAIVTSLIV